MNSLTGFHDTTLNSIVRNKYNLYVSTGNCLLRIGTREKKCFKSLSSNISRIDGTQYNLYTIAEISIREIDIFGVLRDFHEATLSRIPRAKYNLYATTELSIRGIELEFYTIYSHTDLRYKRFKCVAVLCPKLHFYNYVPLINFETL